MSKNYIRVDSFNKFNMTAGNVVEITNMQELQDLLARAESENKKIILDTFATWCGPCKAIAPYFAGLSVNPELGSWIFAKVDIDIGEDVAQHLGVSCMPTFYVFADGSDKPVNSASGGSPKVITDLLGDYKS